MASGSSGPDNVSASVNRVAAGLTLHTCQGCQRVFESVRGLSQHKRSVHPSSYHDALAASAAVRQARWDREEMVLMGREDYG